MNSGTLSPKRIPVITNGTTLVHLDFLLTGIVMTFLGPLLPILSARWSLSDVRAGYLIFTQFFSSMFGMLLSGLLVRRIGYRRTLMTGLALMASGMFLIAFGPYPLGIASVCILGIGYGITSPAGNLRTAETNPERRAAALNVLNAVWGIGAMSCPFLIALAQNAYRISFFLCGTAATVSAVLLAFSLTRFMPDTHTSASESGAQPGDGVWKSKTLPMICALFFIYVGTETSFGAWVATYAHRLDPADHSFWAIMPAFFWGSLLAGRSLAPLALKFHHEITVAKTGLCLGLAGGVTLVSAHGITAIIPGAMLAGLGLACIFPISVSLLPGWFGNSVR